MSDGPPWAPGYRHLTEDLPPLSFGYRARLEDFQVEELPLYPAAGEGEHLMFRLEKRGLSTLQALGRLSRALDVPRRSFGYAGLKDARALTRQAITVAGVRPEELAALDLPGLLIDRIERHPHKLRVGHLAGNRFRLRLRGLAGESLAVAEAVLERVLSRGLPNYAGPQRFGWSGRSHELGRLLALGRRREYLLELLGPRHCLPPDAAGPGFERRAAALAELHRAVEQARPVPRSEHARLRSRLAPDLARLLPALERSPDDAAALVRALDRKVCQLHLSALQSRAFNAVLARRMPDLQRLEPGDLAWLHDRGACFLVEDAAEARRRAADFEISPSGPVFGHKMTPARGRPGEIERAELDALDLEPADFGRIGPGLDQKGARRPLRVPVRDARLRPEEGDAVLEFSLPKGAFASVLVEELGKFLRGEAP